MNTSIEVNATRKLYRGVAGLDVFGAARDSLREAGFRLAVDDPARGRLVSYPKEGTAESTGTWSDTILPGRSAVVRRTAEMRLTPRDDGAVMVACKVLEERRDTTRRRAFASEHFVDDAPNRSPDDLAAEPASPRDEWTPIGTDDRLERQILDALLERILQLEPAG